MLKLIETNCRPFLKMTKNIFTIIVMRQIAVFRVYPRFWCTHTCPEQDTNKSRINVGTKKLQDSNVHKTGNTHLSYETSGYEYSEIE